MQVLDLIWDPDDQNQIICLACPYAKGGPLREVRIKASSRTSHIKSEKHRRGVQLLEQGSALTGDKNCPVGESSAPPASSESFATASLLDAFIDRSEDGDEGFSAIPSANDDPFWRNPLQDESMDEYYDDEGEPVVFTAGILSERERDLVKNAEELEFQLTHLELQNEEAILGKERDSLAESFWNEPENEPQSDGKHMFKKKVGMDLQLDR
jgi:hypothetical protein